MGKANQSSSMNTAVVLIIVTVVFATFIYWIVSSSNQQKADTSSSSTTISTNVSTDQDLQVINMTATGSGYGPAKTYATSNKKSKIVMTSTGAFGCQQSLTIPKLNIAKTIPANGTTEIEIAAQAAGTKLVGSCSMGMYTFTINFI